jgi:hypothetical protein
MESLTQRKRWTAAILNVLPLGLGYIYLRQKWKACRIVAFWIFWLVTEVVLTLLEVTTVMAEGWCPDDPSQICNAGDTFFILSVVIVWLLWQLLAIVVWICSVVSPLRQKSR